MFTEYLAEYDNELNDVIRDIGYYHAYCKTQMLRNFKSLRKE